MLGSVNLGISAGELRFEEEFQQIAISAVGGEVRLGIWADRNFSVGGWVRLGILAVEVSLG